MANNYLIVASDFKPKSGGRADYIDNLAKGLIELGNRVNVLAVVQRHRTERIAFLKQYQKWVIPFDVIHDQRPGGALGNKFVSLLEIIRCVNPTARRFLEKLGWFRSSADSVARLKNVLSQENPDLIVFGHLDIRLYPFVLYLLESQTPYAIIAHESEIYRFSNRKNDTVRRGLMLRGAKWIVANSKHTKALVEMWNIPNSRIRIVYPPISEEAIRADVDLENIHETKDELNIVTICRLVKAKGIDIVIRALKILDGRRIPYRYIVCGEGSEGGALKTLTEELGLGDKVRFMGYVRDDEKWQLLRGSDVFVMPSRVNPATEHEGFGIAFVEAAAFGLPAIGSRAGGIPDAVVDGETGILVPEDSPEDIADALTFLYQNPEKRLEMGWAGMKRAKKDFSPTAVATCFQREICGNV